MKQRRLPPLLLVILASYCSTAVALIVPLPLASSKRKIQLKPTPGSQIHHESRAYLLKSRAEGLHAAVVAVPEALPVIGIGKVLGSIFGAALLYLARRRRLFLWPGVRPDPGFSEPLPSGSLGCPFFGSNVLAGSYKKGPEKSYRKASERLGHPRVWKFYFLGTPVAAVSGAALVQKVAAQEFSTADADTSPEASLEKPKQDKKRPMVFGRDSLVSERNKERHAFLRRLVGSGMTSSALRQALPTIQGTAQDCIDQLLLEKKEKTVRMESFCMDYTLDITQRQLLGLDEFPASEQVVMREQLNIWLSAIFSLLANLISGIPFLVRRSKPFKARQYIEAKLEEKIDSLLENGPDQSILSNMLFATDEEHQCSKLSRDQVINNALLLVAAGVENSASTMTLALLLLGLHPDAYAKLVNEQYEFQSRHGDKIPTQELLDNECPYLDGVVKEAMRLGPVSGGFARRARRTIIIDGKQIPKGWPIFPTIRLTHQLDPVSRLPDDSHMDVHKGFDPERWFHSSTTPTDFIPFGAGPRYCLGASLALMEIKVFLAMLARSVASFRLVGKSASGEIKWNPRTMVPRAADGVQMIEFKEVASVD